VFCITIIFKRFNELHCIKNSFIIFSGKPPVQDRNAGPFGYGMPSYPPYSNGSPGLVSIVYTHIFFYQRC